MKNWGEVKLKELIRDEFEFDLDEKIIIINATTNVIEIPIKRKEEKNFEWYVNEYCKLQFLVNSGVNYEVRDRKATEFIESFYRMKYNDIPFEIKLGLLKFIFNEINGGHSVCYSFTEHLRNMQEITKSNFDLNKNTLCSLDYEILNICPKNYLKSIF
jgi:hypothetical protein